MKTITLEENRSWGRLHLVEVAELHRIKAPNEPGPTGMDYDDVEVFVFRSANGIREYRRIEPRSVWVWGEPQKVKLWGIVERRGDDNKGCVFWTKSDAGEDGNSSLLVFKTRRGATDYYKRVKLHREAWQKEMSKSGANKKLIAALRARIKKKKVSN